MGVLRFILKWTFRALVGALAFFIGLFGSIFFLQNRNR